MKTKILRGGCLLFSLLNFSLVACGQVFLCGTNYTQNFNTLSNGLPTGWTIRTGSTATSLGTVTTLNTNAVSWGTQAGQFGNCAAPVSNPGTNFTGLESTTVQGDCTNRALAIRQISTFGDPGAAFVFQIGNTVGFSNFTFSVDLCLLKPNGYATTWTIDYAVSNPPAAFTPLGTFSDPGVFGATRRNFTLGTDADNQTNSIWIRVAALSAATGSGSRDTFGIDNFVLTCAGAPPAVPLCLHACGTNAVLNWDDSSYTLQAAPTAAGTFTNVTGAASPFTNALTEPAKFFRLCR